MYTLRTVLVLQLSGVYEVIYETVTVKPASVLRFKMCAVSYYTTETGGCGPKFALSSYLGREV